jgi:hypothetical protein
MRVILENLEGHCQEGMREVEIIQYQNRRRVRFKGEGKGKHSICDIIRGRR